MILAEDLQVQQIPLIHVIESDDLYLLNQADVLWFDVLRNLNWRSLVDLAARYYEALYQFNEDQAAERRRNAQASRDAGPTESQTEATERLLFERATMCESVPILHQCQAAAEPSPRVDPRTLRPGRPPARLAGKAPKCFFAMLKAFLGVTLQGKAPEPETVHEELTSNPSFARTCGFTLPHARLGYRQSDVPSLRKLEQFDQIMTQRGLWSEAALDQVARNLRENRVQSESTLVHDTTHYPAFSAMRVVEIPASNKSTSSRQKRRKKKRKSHPKTTKRCRCPQRQTCRHPWVSADEGAGTVAKATGLSWAHKASTLAFPGQAILLDAVAMSDAASHDSQSLKPHLQRLFQHHPDLKRTVTRILDDGAADDPNLKNDLQSQWGIELLAPINPRRRQPIRDDLPRGIDHVTASGTPVCQEGYPFELIGTRHDTERFLFRAPADENGTAVCRDCSKRNGCYRGESGSRQVSIAFERLPWLDPAFPQLSKRFQKAMAKRTAIERLHKLMKYDFGDERLTKRGNEAFQARLDKTLLVMHLVLAHD